MKDRRLALTALMAATIMTNEECVRRIPPTNDAEPNLEPRRRPSRLRSTPRASKRRHPFRSPPLNREGHAQGAEEGTMTTASVSDYERIKAGTRLDSLRVRNGCKNHVHFEGSVCGYIVRERHASRGRYGWKWVGYLAHPRIKVGEPVKDSASNDRMATARAVAYAYLLKTRSAG